MTQARAQHGILPVYADYAEIHRARGSDWRKKEEKTFYSRQRKRMSKGHDERKQCKFQGLNEGPRCSETEMEKTEAGPRS